MTHDEVLYRLRRQLRELAFLRANTALDPASQKTYEVLCERARELMRAV